MKELTTDLLGRASRTFLTLAYPDGNIPPGKRIFWELQPGQALEPLLKPPLCQELPTPDGGTRGYAFRLGCSWFPHVKLQVIACPAEPCVFGVDTHDAMNLDPNHPDVPRLAKLQADNRRLKQQIERAWEAEGLRTFNALLRAGLRGA